MIVTILFLSYWWIGIELGNAIVEHLENWCTLAQNDPMKLKHRWLTYSDTIRNGLSAELFIRLSQISPTKKQDIKSNDQDNQSL